MFKDSHITRMDPWNLVEEADAMPEAALPAFVGSSKIGIGLDAAGLQSLPDRLAAKYHCNIIPWHSTQAELYVLREGMLSEHLWQDEITHTGFDPDSPQIANTLHRNYMPLGYLTQSVKWNGQVYEGDEIRRLASTWRRDWSLKEAIVRTQLGLERDPVATLTIEVFTPHGGETVYMHVKRTKSRRPILSQPNAQRDAASPELGRWQWQLRLTLETRHGTPLYDQAGSAVITAHTLTARIDGDSAHKPVEPYAAVYAVAATGGASVSTSTGGIAATIDGSIDEPCDAYLRIDLRRLAGSEIGRAHDLAAHLELSAAEFSQADYEEARREHIRDFAHFWSRAADIEVDAPDDFEVRRRLLMHMSQYFLRCGNDFGMGGSGQFLLFHQNGWQAGNFHDHHYILDGAARANLFDEALANVKWMRKVMRPQGRVFPWIINYDGVAPIPLHRDRAPMSDANRAMLAVRVYELCGAGREKLLEECVYPIARAVADSAAEWFVREPDGTFLLRGVETDVMDDIPQVNEIGTVVIFDAVLRKAIEYSELLGVDLDRREKWRELAAGLVYDQTGGRYRAYRDAPQGTRTSPWFSNGVYLGEAKEFLDIDIYRATLDSEPPTTICNWAWLNSAAASSQMRIGRPDRAEQLMVDSIENRVHGPGYFEECAPAGLYALPPFPTAHGSYLTAVCEQILLSDFWRPGIAIGTSLPSRQRGKRIAFHGLRAVRGIIASGVLEPRAAHVTLTPTGAPVRLPVTLAIPSAAGSTFNVTVNGEPHDYVFGGETVAVDVPIGEHPVTVAISG